MTVRRSLFVFRAYAVDRCGDCPYFEHGYPDARDNRDECGRENVAFDQWQADLAPPTWCPFRVGAQGSDFTGVPLDVLADLQVAIYRHLNARPDGASQ